MNRIFSLLQNFLLRQVVILCLVGFAFFGLQIVNSSYILAASAETVTSPEGIYYKGTPDENVNKNLNNYHTDTNRFTENTKSGIKENTDNAKNILQETADNVREKLNLDEPTPRATKEFLKSTEKKVEKAVEPLTKTREGYYQIP